MVKKGLKDVTPVDIFAENYDAIKPLANGNIRAWVNGLIARRLIIDKLLKKRYPHLRIVEVEGDCATLVDKEKHETFDVCVDKKTLRLTCSTDKNDICDHVRYLLISSRFTDMESMGEYLAGKIDKVIDNRRNELMSILA